MIKHAGYAALLAGLALLQFLPGWLAGRTIFWGDLTYLHHPWRALPAQLIQSGRLPLWNPYLYLGMPMAAGQQGAVFYPGTLPFYIFGFSTATAIFQAWHYSLAGWLAFFWLRRHFSGLSSFAGALVFSLGGGLISRIAFLNHLAVLSFLPALFIFFHRPLMLALVLACAFLAGYPPFLVGSVASAWALSILIAPAAALGTPRPALKWAGAALAAAGLSACVLLPAAELARLSHRAAGIDLSERLRFAFDWGDLRQWVSPLLLPWKNFDPAGEWWKCSYLGFGGWLAAVLGWLRLKRGPALGILFYLGVVLVLILGGALPLSGGLWSRLAPLAWVRYPGNMAYLAWPALAMAVAMGIERRRWGLILTGVIALELTAYAKAMPWTSRDIFVSPGPLVRRLQDNLGGHRYLLSPRALENQAGNGVMDWKHRLYGLTNAPFRLRSAGNFGDPLPPQANYLFMDALYGASSAEQASRLFPWADILFLMTPEKLPPGAAHGLRDEGSSVWRVYRLARPIAAAYGFDGPAGARLPAGLPTSGVETGRPLAVLRPREDRFTVQGNFTSPGWAYISEPRYPGWEIRLETPRGLGRVQSEIAFGAFQKVAVPAGPWRLLFEYAPLSWRLGSMVSVLSLAGLAVLAAWPLGKNAKA